MLLAAVGFTYLLRLWLTVLSLVPVASLYAYQLRTTSLEAAASDTGINWER